MLDDHDVAVGIRPEHLDRALEHHVEVVRGVAGAVQDVADVNGALGPELGEHRERVGVEDGTTEDAAVVRRGRHARP